MEKEEKKTLSSRVNAWLMKYRVVLLSVVGLLIVAAIVFAMVYYIDLNNKKTGFNTLDDLQYQYVNVKNENSPSEETEEQKEKVQEILIQVKNPCLSASLTVRKLKSQRSLSVLRQSSMLSAFIPTTRLTL